MTPFHLLSGINNLQLIFLSFAVIISDTYLHMRVTRRNLIYSYIPTSLILAGLGPSIILNEVDTSYILHYIVFGIFLSVILLDHRYILTKAEKEPDRMVLRKKKPVVMETKAVGPVYKEYIKQPVVAAAKNLEFKEVPETFIKNVQTLLDELQLKTKKLEALENDMSERREKLIEQEKLFKDYIKSYVDLKEKPTSLDKNLIRETPREDQILVGEKIKDQLIIDNRTDCVAIIQRGILKKINDCFANLLGYQPEEIVNKNLFVFISPEGMEEVRKHYLGRLKGSDSGSYKTVFLKKDNSRISVEITVEKIVYDGENAEVIIIREV